MITPSAFGMHLLLRFRAVYDQNTHARNVSPYRNGEVKIKYPLTPTQSGSLISGRKESMKSDSSHSISSGSTPENLQAGV